MAGLCDSTVLTGQDGMIQFKPPGTSVCVRDFSAFGTDGDATHITMPCTHDFRVNDIVIFREEQGGNLDSAFAGFYPCSCGNWRNSEDRHLCCWFWLSRKP